MAKSRRIDEERRKPPRDRMTAAEVDAWTRFEQAGGQERNQLDTAIVQRMQMAVGALSNAEVKNHLAHDDAKFKLLASTSAEFLILGFNQGLQMLKDRDEIGETEDEQKEPEKESPESET